jgi:hypothetical protein
LARFCRTGRAGAVAEQDARVAILPVHDGGKFFRANDEHRVVGAGHDKLLGNFQTVDKAGAGSLQVEGGGAQRTDFLLDQAGRGRKRHIGCNCCHDDQINLLAGNAGVPHCPQGSFGSHVGGELVLRRDVPFFDAGAARDPFVGGIHHFSSS